MPPRNDLRSSCIPLIALVMVNISAAFAAPSAEPAKEAVEFFEKKVRPLISDRCFECHGENKQKGGLRLDSGAGLATGGESGAVVIPGDPANSRLVLAVSYTDPDLKMPPKNPLSAEERRVLETWVQLGAVYPGGAADAPAARREMIVTDKDREHWSFTPVKSAAQPAVKDAAWCTSPVDYFVLAELERAGIRPAPRADKRTLIRRVYFDLIGLPPPPEAVAAFLRDESADAFKTVVEQLLASPRYGERWARHWLDIVRFAQTNGHNRDPDKANMFRYRDYVIEAFNDDLPYDRFLREQVAGDLMPPRPMASAPVNARMVATGMLWSYELVYNPAEPAEQRADQIDSQLDIIGKGMLGLTVTCARCHDHKFEAIPTRDYYALAGILHSTRGVERPASLGDHAPQPRPEPPVKVAANDGQQRRRREISRAAQYMMASLPLVKLPGTRALNEAEKVAKETGLDLVILRRWVTFLKLTDTPRNPNVGPWRQISDHPEDQFAQAVKAVLNKKEHGALADRAFNPLTVAALEDPAVTSLEALAQRYQAIMLEVFDKQRESDPVHKQWLNWFRRADTPYTLSVFSPEASQGGPAPGKKPQPKQPTAPMAMASAEADDARYDVYQVHMASSPESWSLPRDPSVGDVPIHLRGQVGRYGDIARRGFLSVLPGGGPASIKAGSGRAELADWLASPQNPLTPRVMVNRIWQHHFGEGIVATPNDFGVTGVAPTNQPLLDDLARRFIDSGWSIKAMHRLMVLSSTYQTDSRASDDAQRLDPANRLLSHTAIRRLEAESVRDAMLATAGTLKTTMYGPGVPPHITPFMYPRFQPKSGPVDGDGRRSIYITVRRNFLTPMLLSFDFPNPSEPVGRRESANVPTQALTLLNNEFVHGEATAWAQRVVAASGTDDQRITAMYERGLGRPPEAEELAAMREFLIAQRQSSGVGPQDPGPWADLAHAIFNTKAFIFIR